MTFNPDDPKWTAYILGELDAAEREAMENVLETSEDARAYMEELRVAAGALEHELKAGLKIGFPPEINAGLTAKQREQIQSAAGLANGTNLRRFKLPQVHQAWVAGLAAAMILIVVATPFLWHKARTAGTSPEPALSASATKPEEGISPSPAVPSEEGLKAEGSAGSSAAKDIETARQNTQAVPGTPVLTPQDKIGIETRTGSTEDLRARQAAGVEPQSSLNSGGAVRDELRTNSNQKAEKAASGDAPLNVPGNPDDLLAYLTKLAQLRGGAANPIDGFQNAQILPPTPQAQAQGGRQAAGGGGRGGGGRGGAAAGAPAAPAGIGGGVGGGVFGGVAGGLADSFSTFGAAPGAAPPPSPPAEIGAIPDNPALVGLDNVRRPASPGTASYAAITDNPFIRVSQYPLSTFSSDVDTASYSNLRRFLNQGQQPPRDAVRIEEMLNYFTYDYAQPSGRDPIGAQMEIASAPWNPSHRLVRIGIKARDIDARRRPASNLVFLIDVSGSMQPQERLPLIKSGLKMLVSNLTENDHVSIVVYAGASGVVLPSTSGNRKDIISGALDRLEAGGSTNGGAGIQLAYQLAAANFITGGVNRVILATDGDFNVGVTNQSDLTRLIQDRAKSGVFLSVLGVGTDNLKDSTMEKLADTGNGNYAYLDSLNEAYKVLVQQMGGTLMTVAKDVKLQVEFNPVFVEAYRLIGYENRVLANADFNNDRKDAGDMGAGHTVTALYEIVPRGGSVPGPGIDPLKYQTQAPVPQVRNGSNETLTLKIRYKDPDGTESKLLSLPLVDREGQFSRASVDFRFAASVAEFGMILRDSPYRGNGSVNDVLDNAQASRGPDRNGYRQEFIGLVQRARSIRGLNP